MVTLSTVLLVGLIASIISAIGTLALVVLGKIYLSTRKNDDDGGLTLLPIPGGMGGMGRALNITQADVDRAKKAMSADAGGGGSPVVPDAEAYNPGGYI